MPVFSIQYPMINGHRYSWASVEAGFTAAGVIMRGIKSAEYDHSLTPAKMRGTGPNVVGRTRGEYDAKLMIEFYRLEYENYKALVIQAAGVAGIGFGEVAVPIMFQYADLGQPVVTDTLEGCRIVNPQFSGAEGSDPQTVKVTFDVTRILENGAPLYSITSGG